MGMLFGGGGGGGYMPQVDSGALVAERQRQEQEAREQAIKDRENRARTGGRYSLFSPLTGALGVVSKQTLGGTA